MGCSSCWRNLAVTFEYQIYPMWRCDGAPMVNYTWEDYMPHATMTEMSFRIWEEFFSKFSRVDGEIKYNPGV